MRVISSPSSSTTGVLTLIFAITSSCTIATGSPVVPKRPDNRTVGQPGQAHPAEFVHRLGSDNLHVRSCCVFALFGRRTAPSAPWRRPSAAGIMKPDKHLLGALAIILAAIGLIALTWVGTMRAIHIQRLENITRVNAILANQVLTLTEQISRQLLALDQTL